MKTCDYCLREHEDAVEECCSFSAFTPVVDGLEVEKNSEVKMEELVQPAAHELLKELVDAINLDEVSEKPEPLPEWISNIPYEDVKASAKEKYLEENPGLVTRIKKYLEM